MSWELGISAEVVAQTAPRVCGAPSLLHRQGGEEEEEEGIFKAKTIDTDISNFQANLFWRRKYYMKAHAKGRDLYFRIPE